MPRGALVAHRTVCFSTATASALAGPSAAFATEGTAWGIRAIGAVAQDRLRYSGDWRGLGWQHAPDAWIERTWPQAADTLIGALAKVSCYNAKTQKIPVVAPSGLRIVNAGAAAGTAGVTVLPPTEAGARSSTPRRAPA